MKITKSTLVTASVVIVSLALIYFPFKGFIRAHISEIGINAIGVYLGFLGATIIYLLQIRDNFETAKRDILSRHKEHLRYFAGVVADVINYANKQAEALDIISEAIKKQSSTIHQLGFIASDSISRLNRADSEATFHAYNLMLRAVLPGSLKMALEELAEACFQRVGARTA